MSDSVASSFAATAFVRALDLVTRVPVDGVAALFRRLGGVVAEPALLFSDDAEGPFPLALVISFPKTGFVHEVSLVDLLK